MVTEKKTPKHKVKNPKNTKVQKLPKKNIKLVKSSLPSQESLFSQGPSGPDLQPPDGFRLVSATQALTEYAGPLMEMIPMPDDVSKANEIFGVVPEIWNYTLDDKVIPEGKKSEKEMLSLISQRLGLDQKESHDFLSMMVERKHFLFPAEVQPKGSPYMFIRKEVSFLISRFDYERLNINPEVLPPDALDLKLVKNLNKLDQYIRRSADYAKYEKLLLNVQDAVLDRFNIWLDAKGVREHQRQIAFIAEGYLIFIYGYQHEQPLTLKDRPGRYLAEFVVDYLLRKTSLEPWEYTLAPSTLRLIYSFLHEKEYLDKPPDMMMEFIDRLDPPYIDVLKEHFS
jgi:hypothetical protein